jgi:hypothetical protein
LSKRSTFAQEKRELRQQKQQCHFIPSVIKKRSKDCGWLLRVKGVSSEEMNWIRNVEKLGTRLPWLVIAPVRIWVGLNSILATITDTTTFSPNKFKSSARQPPPIPDSQAITPFSRCMSMGFFLSFIFQEKCMADRKFTFLCLPLSRCLF